MKKKAAVLGYPTNQSLSPALHGFWLKQYNIDGEYGKLNVAPADLQKTLRSFKENDYVGCNLTIPHKEAAFKIVDTITDVAKAIGAVNTVVVEKDGKLTGTNTDAEGFIENIKHSEPRFYFKNGKAVVLGAGGASRAVIYGLLKEGVSDIILTNRTRDRAEELAKFFGGRVKVADWDSRNEILQNANLLVNTTSLGMEGQPELDINLDLLPKTALVTDIVYKPLETNLLKNARNRGNYVVDGLGMLLYQAVAGFKMWFGKKPEVTKELREYVLSQIKPKDHER